MIRVRNTYAPQVGNQKVPGIYLNPEIPAGAFGQGIGEALSRLGVALQGQMDQTKNEADTFAANKAYLDEVSGARIEYDRLTNEAPLGAEKFSELTYDFFEKRHATILDNLRKSGMDPAKVDETALKLQSLRDNILAQSLKFQSESFRTKIKGDVTTTADGVAKTVMASPRDLEAGLEELNTFIESVPGIDAPTKAEWYKEYSEKLRLAAGYGLAESDPDRTKRLLNGEGPPLPKFLTPASLKQLKGVSPTLLNIVSLAEKYLPEGYAFQVGDLTHGKGGVGGLRTRAQQAEIVKRGDSKTMRSKHLPGLAVDLTPIYVGKFGKDGTPDKGVNGIPLENKEAFNIVYAAMQQAADELGVKLKWGGKWKPFQDFYHYEIDEVAGPAPAGSVGAFITSMKTAIAGVETPGSKSPYGEIGPPVKRQRGKGVVIDHAYGKYQVMGANIASWTKLALGKSVSISEFRNSPEIQEAVFEDQMARLYRRYGNARDAASVWFTGVPYAQALKEGRHDGNIDVAEYIRRMEGGLGKAPPSTGDPVLDRLSFEEQNKILNVATTKLNQNDAFYKAQLDLDTTNATAAFMRGMPYEGAMPTEDRFLKAYGPIAGPQKWEDFKGTMATGEFMSQMATLSEKQIMDELAARKPTNTASPTFATEMATYDAAGKAAAAVMKERTDDAADYVIRNYPAVKEAASRAAASGSSADRAAFYASMAKAYDQLGIPAINRKALPTDAIETTRKRLSELPAEQKIAELINMRREMGEDLFYVALGQLEKAGMEKEAYVAGLVDKSPSHQIILANALRGIDRYTADKSLTPSWPAIDAAFRTYLGKSQLFIPPQAAQAIKELAAGLYIFNGGSPGDTAASPIDPNLFESAVRQVLGGGTSYETGIVDMSKGSAGYKTVLPPNVTREEFQTWLKSTWSDDWEKMADGKPFFSDGRPAKIQDIIDEGVFVRVGAEDYIILMGSDGGELQTAAGMRYFVHITEDMVKAGNVTPSARKVDRLSGPGIAAPPPSVAETEVPPPAPPTATTTVPGAFRYRPMKDNELIAPAQGEGLPTAPTKRPVLVNGEWVVAPLMWARPDGDVLDLEAIARGGRDIDAALSAMISAYEQSTGSRLPRFATEKEALEYTARKAITGGRF